VVEDFPRILSLLRQEKGISQRAAAAKLNVSQALLSHYENGAREPGFSFLLKAASFYGVSTDYLLGRTMSRENFSVDMISDSGPTGEANDTDKTKCFHVAVQNTITLIFDLIGRMNCDESVRNAFMEYMCLAVYKVFRYLYMASPNARDDLFAVSSLTFAELSDIEMKRAEVKLKMTAYEAHGNRCEDVKTLPNMNQDSLSSIYPELSHSVMAILDLSGNYLSAKHRDDEENSDQRVAKS